MKIPLPSLLAVVTLAAAFSACGGGGGGGSPASSAAGLSGGLEETRRPEQSASGEWWLSSGGRFLEGGGFGSTIQGDLPPEDPWRQLYSRTNPRDTDGGAHPQNVFRIVRRAVAGDHVQTLVFRVTRTNASASGARNASNSVSLFSNYQNEDNLYVTGLRVDGFVTVKRKNGGGYRTLGEARVLPGSYDRGGNPNLIPNRSITLTSETRTNPDGSLSILVSIDGNPALEVRDPRPLGPGLTGIRTDFMDVVFESYGIG